VHAISSANSFVASRRTMRYTSTKIFVMTRCDYREACAHLARSIVTVSSVALSLGLCALSSCQLLWPISEYDSEPAAIIGNVLDAAVENRPPLDSPEQGEDGTQEDGPPPPLSCSNNDQDGAETDVDCGGDTCPKCGPDKSCLENRDCKGAMCVANRCAQTCSDQSQNNHETDVDCGGDRCSGCGPGLSCLIDTDCTGGVCTDNKCAPSCSDSVQNGSETDTDCGASCTTTCKLGQKCGAPADCASGSCEAKHCVDCTKSTGWNPPTAVSTEGGNGALGNCGFGCWAAYNSPAGAGPDSVLASAVASADAKWFALCDVPVNSPSKFVRFTGFHFDGVPDSAIIKGISIRIVRGTSGNIHPNHDDSLQLLKGGTALATPDRSTKDTLWPPVSSGAGCTQADYGGDTWETTWTPAQIRDNAGFGFRFRARNYSTSGTDCSSAYIDQVQMSVRYCQ
jgi:hypothetical protein